MQDLNAKSVRFEKLHLHNYGVFFGSHNFMFERQQTIIVGDHATGKTTIVNALANLGPARGVKPNLEANPQEMSVKVSTSGNPKFVEKYSNFFEWVRPNAGAIAFMKFKGPMNSDELGEILAKSGISIKPAYVFADDSDYFEDYFRIGYGEKIMPRALQALIDFVEEHREQWAVKMNEGCK